MSGGQGREIAHKLDPLLAPRRGARDGPRRTDRSRRSHRRRRTRTLAACGSYSKPMASAGSCSPTQETPSGLGVRSGARDQRDVVSYEVTKILEKRAREHRRVRTLRPAFRRQDGTPTRHGRRLVRPSTCRNSRRRSGRLTRREGSRGELARDRGCRGTFLCHDLAAVHGDCVWLNNHAGVSLASPLDPLLPAVHAGQ